MDERLSKYSFIPFYFLLLLIIIVPFTISMYFENPVVLVKSSAFEISGALFIIFTIVILMESVLKDNQKYTLYFNKTIDLPVLFFIIAAIISTIFSINPLVSVFGHYQREIGLVTFIYLVLIYFFSSRIFINKQRLTALFFITELVAVVISVYSCLQMLGLDPFGMQPDVSDRPISTFGNAVFLGGFLILIFPFSILNIASKRNRIIRIAFPLIILVGIVISGTRSAYLAAAAEIVILTIFYFVLNRDKKLNISERAEFKKKLKYILIALIAVITFSILLILIFPESFLAKRFLSIFYSADNPRFVLWRDSIGIFFKYPITGAGIAVFSSAFEEFYSNRLRFLESSSYFDHPHNNFLYFLYSMGVLGLIAYFNILIQSVRVCISGIFRNEDFRSRTIFISFTAFLTGYIVYGLTNFDEITILLYFFVFVAAIKSMNIENTKRISVNTKLIFIIGIPIILFLSYNMYSSLNDLRADRFFKLGNNLIREGKFAEAIYNMNAAIALNDYCTDYKFAVAYTVYRQCFSSESMSKDNKMNLLSQSAAQIEKLTSTHYFKNECDGLLSLIYYEMGRDKEAEVLERKVLDKDSVNISYRTNLARYYIKKGNYIKAEELMVIVLYLRPKALETNLTAAYLYFMNGNMEKSKIYCFKILQSDSGNHFALKLLNEINSVK